VIANTLLTMFFLGAMTLVCFFTLFNSRVSDFLQLVPKHTDCLQFQATMGMCCKLIVRSFSE
jgi:hypothetical protein